MRRIVFALSVGALVLAVAGSAAGPPEHAALALTILPPGENGGVAFDRNTTDQAKLYDALTPLGANVTDRDLRRLFKPAPLALQGKPTRTARPRAGVTIARDSFGIPYVSGRTQEDVAFGAGYATAEDRGLLLALIRGPARAAALDIPGVDPIGLALSGRTFVPSAQTEAFLASQIAAVNATGSLGRRFVRIVRAYAAGINAYYKAKDQPTAPYTANDVIAAAALIAARFGANGGQEAHNAMLLDALQKRLGERDGRLVFDDLRQQHDVEAPVSVPGSFPYELAAGGPGGVVLDDGSYGAAPAVRSEPMSNALLLGRSRSATGRPLFVAGPQVGYFFPQFFMEISLSGGGFGSRGALFPGVPFVVIGRGVDYAWSATSSQADNVDLFAETLCGGDDQHYLHNGTCRAMTRFDAGLLRAPGRPDQPLSFLETVHGPVQGYATVRGRRVAIALQRSTRGRELLSARAFYELDTNAVTSARSFLKTMNGVEFSFNWLYADSRDIAMFSSGRLPLRAPGVDSALPTVGTGEYDWRGFLPAQAHAQAVNPPGGAILNWNNKPAAGVGSADSNFAYGSVQRVDLFTPLVAARAKHTAASLVGVMNKAATQDLRVLRVWPVIRDAIFAGGAPTGRTLELVGVLDDWRAQGGSRLDGDLDGKIDHPGAALMDEAWPRIADAVLSPVLGPLTERLAELHGRSDDAGPGGSSYISGWYGYVEKTLRAQLGRPVRQGFSRHYCGNGDRSACHASLRAALDAAGATLAAAQGPNPAAWRADATRERIRFTSGILPDTMRWTNRPTFQQVMSFRTHR
jgi:acyl-homoserine lactone acylase PvdQ